jgi:hypothetical protein
MDWLEQELKMALARNDPPEGFAERVARRATARTYQRPRWLAAAAALVLFSGAGLGYRQYRGQMAKEQVMRAMRIASVKVNHIQAQVREVAR